MSHQRRSLRPWLAFPLPQEILHATDAEHGLTNQASLLSVATPIPEEISLIPPINDAAITRPAAGLSRMVSEMR